MQITLLTRPDIIQAALEIAETAPPSVANNLQAPTGDLLGKLEEVWDDVRWGIGQVWNRSAQEAREIARAVRTKVEAKLAQAGAQAEALRVLLLDRIGKYLQAILDTMLGTVRARIAVDGLQLKLSELQLSQTVTLGNSLELSLTKVLEISAEGQMTVAATYSISP
jgi:hypothetical protein